MSDCVSIQPAGGIVSYEAYSPVYAVVRFEANDRGVFGNLNDLRVYPHRDYPGVIGAGEVWLCELQLNRLSGANYFATPVEKLDMAKILEAVPELKTEVIRYISENCIEPSISVADQDEASESGVVENQPTDEGLVERADLEIAAEASARNDAEDDQTVSRTGPQTLHSKLFTDSRYFVSISPDHSMIMMRPHAGGSIICRGNSIRVSGLERMIPFENNQPIVCKNDSNGILRLMF